MTSRATTATTVRGVLHPVGRLPAAVYWRRRLTVLVLLVAVLGGGGWLGFVGLTGRGLDGTPAAVAAPPTQALEGTPALEQVVPSVAAVRTPSPLTAVPTGTTPTAPAPKPGGPCTDAMLAVSVRAAAAVSAAAKPTFDLLVKNVSPVSCVRALDKGLQEILLLDRAGHRIWGSNDCFPEASSDTRTLAPGQVVSFPVVWSGLSSAPGCTAARTRPAPGTYVLRGRLATKKSAGDPAITIS